MQTLLPRIRGFVGSRGWIAWPVLLAGLLAAVYVVVVAVGPDRLRHSYAIAQSVYLPMSFISTALAALTAWSVRGRTRVSYAWTLIAVSFFAFWLGELGWMIVTVTRGAATSPSLADLGYLAYYPLLLGGLMLASRSSGARGQNLRLALDVATLFLTGCLLVWYLVLRPTMQNVGSGLGDAVNVAYPIGDLLLVLGIAFLVVRRSCFRSRAALFSLLAALLIGFVADLGYSYLSIKGVYGDVNPSDVFYAISWFLFGSASALEYAAIRRAARTTAPAVEATAEVTAEVTAESAGVPYVLAYVAVIVAIGVLAWALRHTFATYEGAAVTVAFAIMFLAIARQALAMRENARLREARAIAASEERFQQVLLRTQYSIDHAVEGVYWIEESGRIIDVNEAACRCLEYSRDELVGMSILAIDPAFRNEQARWARNWQEMHAQGSRVFETAHLTRSGGLVPVEITSSHMGYAGKQLSCCFVHDLTSRKQAEQALREVETQLRQAQKLDAIGQLAGGIAHDFNNLLTVILGHCELLLVPDPDLSDSRRADIQAVKSAAERAAALTRQILLFSRRRPLRPETVPANEIVARVSDLLRRTLGELIELVTQLDSEAGSIQVDVAQFEQAITNLAVNARDAMPLGGRLVIETRGVEVDEAFCAAHPGMQPGPHVRLSVSDNGTGMDDATVMRAFEPFFTTKEPGKGTGLGLATTYGTVMQSKGGITVQSKPGLGTTVQMFLPRLAELSQTGRDEEGILPAVAAKPGNALSSERLLLVEDEDGIRDMLSRVLRTRGYEVASAAGADEAMRILEDGQQQLDLLLTDVILPGSTQGGELARRAVALRPGLPILYMSGYTRDIVLKAGRLQDGMHYLQKPFSNDVLLQRVRDVLDQAMRASQS